MKNTQSSELRDKISDILKKLVRDMIVRGEDWPLGRRAMRTNAIDEIIEVVSASSNKAILQKVREIVGEDVPTPSERTIKHIKENNPEELLKLIMWGNNAAHENALRAQIRTDLAKLEGEI